MGLQDHDLLYWGLFKSIIYIKLYTYKFSSIIEQWITLKYNIVLTGIVYFSIFQIHFKSLSNQLRG